MRSASKHNEDSAAVQNFLGMFRVLAPWRNTQDFSVQTWRHYINAAKLVQNSEPGKVELALARFLNEADGFAGVENETRLFLLMRIVFDLPDRAPVDQRRIFRGWVNWPAPDAEGNVNLSWPVDWQDDRPVLLAPFKGADGPRYGVVEDYRSLLARFPFRKLWTANGQRTQGP